MHICATHFSLSVGFCSISQILMLYFHLHSVQCILLEKTSFLIYLLYLILSGLGLHLSEWGLLSLWCAGFSLWPAGFSSCGSPAPEHRLTSCDAQAWLPHSMWNLPGPGIELMSFTLAGWFLTTRLPGTSSLFFVIVVFNIDFLF